MTFKDLSNIIRKRRERLLVELQEHEEKELAEAEAFVNTLRANHDKAHLEREAKWEIEHLGKEFYQRTEEDDRRESTLDEWFWNFFQRVHASKSPEARYQLERNPNHGFGHDPTPKGIHERSLNECVPGCRFYEPTGRLIVFDILNDYRGYQQFEEVLRAYKELEAEDLLSTE